MNEEHKEKIWAYVKLHVQKGIRDVDYWWGDEKLQKEQYLAYRKEIIQYFNEQLGARNKPEIAKVSIETYPYFKDMQDMGIDPYAIFDASKERSNAESDYQNWKSWSTWWDTQRKASSSVSIEQMVTWQTNATLRGNLIPPNFQKPAKAQPIGSKKKPWTDDDANYHGWASQIDSADATNDSQYQRAA